MKILWTFLIVVHSFNVCAQDFEDLSLEKPESPEISNHISFLLPDARVHSLHKSKGEKISVHVPVMVINGDSIKSSQVRIRGNTSSYFQRKSFNIKLEKNASFFAPEDTFTLKQFYAISMSMDRNYIRNRISSVILNMQQVNTPLSCYSELKINNKSEGVYMIYYPPDDFAMTKRNCSLVIRRGYNAAIDKMYHEKLSKEQVNFRKQKFLSIYKVLLKRYEGEQLYQELRNVLDLEGYFNWLAFNHLFQNGDYSDEVYFIWSESRNKFEILPWDFDDILRPQPHEGLNVRNARIGDKLIFSSEDALDVRIALDDFLYRKYIECYQKYLESLTPETLANILSSVFREVYPYYLDEDVIAQSKYDQSGLTDLNNLTNDLHLIHQTIGNRILSIRKQIHDFQDANALVPGND